MSQFSDEELLKCIKSGESEFNTLAEIHKLLIVNKLLCSIEELRQRINSLHQDGFVGNEPTGDGVNMYYIIFCPEMIKTSQTI